MKGRKIAIVVTLVLLGFIAGSAIRELTTYAEAGVGAAIGIPAVIALFGMFWIADNWKDALTAAFAVTYFIFLAGILAIFVFPQQDFQLEGGAKAVVDNFTGLVAIVMAAYFGQEAVRAAAQAYSDGKFFGPGGAGNPGAQGTPAVGGQPGGQPGGGAQQGGGVPEGDAPAAPAAQPARPAYRRSQIDTNAGPGQDVG